MNVMSSLFLFFRHKSNGAESIFVGKIISRFDMTKECENEWTREKVNKRPTNTYTENGMICRLIKHYIVIWKFSHKIVGIVRCSQFTTANWNASNDLISLVERVRSNFPFSLHCPSPNRTAPIEWHMEQ